MRWFQHLFAFRERVDPRRYYCIDYRDLKRNPQATLQSLYRHFGWKMSPSFKRKLAETNEREQAFESTHRYSLKEFGLTKDWLEHELGELIACYGLNGAAHRTQQNNTLANRSFAWTETPPRHMKKAEANTQNSIAHDGRSYLRPYTFHTKRRSWALAFGLMDVPQAPRQAVAKKHLCL